jgi:hypothetical protein
MSLLFLDEVLDADCRVGSVDVRQHRAVAESGETKPCSGRNHEGAAVSLMVATTPRRVSSCWRVTEGIASA